MQRSKLLGTRCGRRKFSSGLYGPDLLKLCGAKGIRTPALTRPNAVFTAVSFRLVPIRSRSLPAGSFSALDGVEIVHLPQRPAGAVSFNTPLVSGPLTIIFVRPAAQAAGVDQGGNRPAASRLSIRMRTVLSDKAFRDCSAFGVRRLGKSPLGVDRR